MVQYRGPFVLKMPDEAWFNVNMMQKDMLLALELGRQVDVPLPTTAATNELLTAARGMGLADQIRNSISSFRSNVRSNKMSTAAKLFRIRFLDHGRAVPAHAPADADHPSVRSSR